MDIWDHVRRFGEHVQMSDDALGRARARLDEAIDRPARNRARLAWLIGGGAGAVVLATTSIAVAASLGPSVDAAPTPTSSASPPVAEPNPSPSASAAIPTPAGPDLGTVEGVLAHASALSDRSAGSVLAGEDYLKVEVLGEQLSMWAVDAELGPQNASRAEATAGWVSTNRYTTFIPADRSAEWVRIFAPGGDIIGLYGVDAESHAERWTTELAETIAMEIVQRTAGGMGEASEDFPRHSDGSYAAMPRDSALLLELFGGARTSESGNPDYLGVFIGLGDELTVNAAPPELRAAMFEAIALIPGVELIAVDGTVATVAYSFDVEAVGLWTETLSIDTESGLVVGNSRTIGFGGTAVPDTIPNGRATVITSVVESAP